MENFKDGRGGLPRHVMRWPKTTISQQVRVGTRLNIQRIAFLSSPFSRYFLSLTPCFSHLFSTFLALSNKLCRLLFFARILTLLLPYCLAPRPTSPFPRIPYHATNYYLPSPSTNCISCLRVNFSRLPATVMSRKCACRNFHQTHYCSY